MAVAPRTVAPMVDNGRDQAVAEREAVGHRRAEWLTHVAKSGKPSRLALQLAIALFWTYSDRKTGETIVKTETLAAYIGTNKNMVAQIIAAFRKAGFIETITAAAPGRPARFRLTLPVGRLKPQAAAEAQPPQSAPQEPTKRSRPRKRMLTPRTPPAPSRPKNSSQYRSWVKTWTGDRDAILSRWNSDDEKELRAELGSGDQAVRPVLNGILDDRLSQFPPPPVKTPPPRRDGLDDEIPF
jgi:hypothetical protein